MTLSHSVFKNFSALFLAGVCALALSACSGDGESTLNRDLAAPERVDVLAPPVAPDPSAMHPALQIARSRGLKTNVYFNEELQQAVARLQGMEETLGRLQSDLQGTAMAMQRVEMMRQEVDALNTRIQSLQERLIYAGPTLEPVPADAQTAVVREDVTPQEIKGDMAKTDAVAAPATDAKAPVKVTMKPVVDDTKSAKPDKTAGMPKTENKAAAPVYDADAKGVVGVRFGTHGETTRIVLDIAGEVKLATNLDNGEKLLTVELPKTAWNAGNTAKEIKGNAVVASYNVQPSGDGKGCIVAFMLKKETKIINSSVLKGVDGKPSRLVVDLAN